MLENLSTPKQSSWLSWFFRGLLILGLLVIVGRLGELQVIKGAYYRDLAENNRVRRVPIVAARGKVFDRNGEVLVDNNPIKKTAKFSATEGYTKELANGDTPENEVITEWERNYKYGDVFGHITGYLGETNEQEVGKVDPECAEKSIRALGAYVGRAGLEQYYNCSLRGINGEELVEVDTRGNRIRALGRKQSIAGEDLHTNLDAKIQKKVAELMQGSLGTAIVSSPEGKIVALYSSPSFDPNKDIAPLLVDKNLPMFNRAISGTYHPGSIYKIVTTVAAVEEGKIDSDYRYEDTGAITIDEFQYNNWYFTQYGGTEGVVDAVRAMARSTDTFYYEVGELIGAEKLSSWSKKFGLADRTGIDLPGEVAGLVPSPEWKKAVKGERWYLGNTYHMAIGQGDLAITPVENHRLAMFVANGGMLCSLKIFGNAECTSLGVSTEAMTLVKEGMKAACDPGGTGVPFFEFSPDVACKTGTAETGVEDETHAWFTVFDVEDPQYVVTILVEKGGEGSKVAAPIARSIMDYIFNP